MMIVDGALTLDENVLLKQVVSVCLIAALIL